MAHESESTTGTWTDTDLGPEDVLGTTTYEDVLYTEEQASTTIPVNVRTGEKVADAPSAAQVREMAASNDVFDQPAVAVATSTETMADVRAGPVTTVVFYNRRVVGSIDRFTAYKAAVEDPRYTVAHEADYETGDLAITVEEAPTDG